MKITPDTVRDIIEHHFGKAPKEVRQLSGGVANFVYEASLNGDRYIVRVSDDHMKLQYFIKEQWAVEKARAMKIPAPEILEVANEAAKYPYMITKYAEGESALDYTDRLEIIREMGKYTKLINEIPTSGYGHVFDWSSNQLSRNETWKDYVEKELKVEDRLAILERHKLLNEDGMALLRKGVREISDWNTKPTLNHGDMRLKNILLDEKDKICCILDWETCSSNIAPQWDVSIALHDLNIHEKEVFLEGYGLTPREYRKRARGMKVINILNYAPYVEYAFEEKEGKRKEILDNMKTRLRGAFDLYSL